MIGKHRVPPIEARGDGAIAAGGNVENVRVHVGDVYAMDALPLKVAALDYSAALADADLDRFVGREWLTSQIEELAAPAGNSPSPGRYVLVRARAGMGKTALAAWLTRQWDCAHHFTRTTGGRDTRTALQSLAAQLVVRYRMQDEFAPGGMLPSWAGDPARFPAVLKGAAQRATARGEQVRLVVDGMDEADGDGPALGLPQPQQQPLPEGVVILATYREGFPVRRIPYGDAVRTVSIDADGPTATTFVASWPAKCETPTSPRGWLPPVCPSRMPLLCWQSGAMGCGFTCVTRWPGCGSVPARRLISTRCLPVWRSTTGSRSPDTAMTLGSSPAICLYSARWRSPDNR